MRWLGRIFVRLQLEIQIGGLKIQWMMRLPISLSEYVSAAKVKVPFSLISREARMKALMAARLRADPRLMRRTPKAASSETLRCGAPLSAARTLTGFLTEAQMAW